MIEYVITSEIFAWIIASLIWISVLWYVAIFIFKSAMFLFDAHEQNSRNRNKGNRHNRRT